MVSVEFTGVYDPGAGVWSLCYWGVDKDVIYSADCSLGGVILGVEGSVSASAGWGLSVEGPWGGVPGF
jgi:hypothetical protein